MDLNRLKLFVAVAEAGGFTRAAERLNVAKTMLSQQISKLEADLGRALFTRTTRKVVLTEAGTALLQRCGPLLAQLDEALGDAEGGDTASGTLRITAPTDYCAGVLAPAIAAFYARHPGLEIELIATHDVVDLIDARIDVAIRMGWLKDSTLRATRLAEFGQWLVAPATPSFALPDHPQALADLPWIMLNLLPSPLRWNFLQEGYSQVVIANKIIECNTPTVVQALVEAGAGISVLPDFMAAPAVEQGRLQRCLADWQLPGAGIYAVYPASRHVPAKVRLFIDFMKDWL